MSRMYIISYLGVIEGVQNFTPVYNSVHPWLHQDNEFISYEAFLYFLLYRGVKLNFFLCVSNNILHIWEANLFVAIFPLRG
jgi:hypothetical protein